MKLESLSISNFRCFDSFSLDLGGESLFIVSANAVGKSSLLAATAKALGADRSITVNDFRDRLNPIEIIATLGGFKPADQGVFPSELDFNGPPTLQVGVRAEWDPIEDEARVSLGFPNRQWRLASRTQRNTLQPWWLPTHRDPGRLLQLLGPNSIVGEIFANLPLEQALADAIAQIEAALESFGRAPEISQLLTRASAELAGLIPNVSAAAFTLGNEASSRQELLRQFSVMLAHASPPIRVGHQSRGLGQLAVFVFALELLKKRPSTILLTDEPEISLHPHAQRSLVSLLRAVPNQSLIATHSPSILDRADPRAVVRLERTPTSVVPLRATSLSDADAESLRRYVNPLTSEAFFARKVVIVEGYSDRVALIAFANLLNRDLDAEGIALVSLDGGAAAIHYARLFGPQGLGVPLLGLCDEDKEMLWVTQLQKAGFAVVDRASLAANGFFVCSKDLEDELIRALAPQGALAVIAAEGETQAFGAFAQQAKYSQLTLSEQLRRFFHKQNIRWATPLISSLTPATAPQPLRDLLSIL